MNSNKDILYEKKLISSLTKANTISLSSQTRLAKSKMRSISSDFTENDIEEKDINNMTGRNIEIPKLNTYMTINLSDIHNIGSLTGRSKKGEFQQTKNMIHLRINSLVNINYFIRNYVYDLNQIYNKIDSIIYRKITNLIDKNKYYVKFFKDLISNFEKFSFSMEETINSLNFHFREDKYNFSTINKELEKTQKTFSNAILEFNKKLSEKLFSKESINDKMKNFHGKISEISKESFIVITELTKKKDKFVSRYLNYEKIFENFKKDYNTYEKIVITLNRTDFYIIEIELSKIVNKLFSLAEKFFLKYIFCLKQLKNICRDFILMILDSINIYKRELKSFFNFNNFIENSFLGKIEETINDDIKNNLFGEKDIFYEASELKELEELIKVFQNNIIKFNFIKNDSIYFDDNFKLEKFKNFEEMIDFFITIIPEKMKFESSNLCLFNKKFNQIQGFFKNERTCIIIITIQDNLIIIDEKYSRKQSQKIDLKNSKFTKIDDKNYPFKFEICEVKFGVLFNSHIKYIFDTKNPEDFIAVKEFFLTENSIVPNSMQDKDKK